MSATIRRLLAEQEAINKKLYVKLSPEASVGGQVNGLNFSMTRTNGIGHVSASYMWLSFEEVAELRRWLNEMYGDEEC